jgi:hypothetical protein
MACKATGELQCRGLRPLCEGLELGGSSVEEGVGQPAGVPKVVMGWSGWPPLLVTMWVIPDFGIWGIFLQGEKFWGGKIRTSFGIKFLQ